MHLPLSREANIEPVVNDLPSFTLTGPKLVRVDLDTIWAVQ